MNQYVERPGLGLNERPRRGDRPGVGIYGMGGQYDYVTFTNSSACHGGARSYSTGYLSSSRVHDTLVASGFFRSVFLMPW